VSGQNGCSVCDLIFGAVSLKARTDFSVVIQSEELYKAHIIVYIHKLDVGDAGILRFKLDDGASLAHYRRSYNIFNLGSEGEYRIRDERSETQIVNTVFD
jgi:hypothetical protein